jgi:predicted DNA-binding transcriptional regulator YafY
VNAERRWYLVAHDLDREAWRTFRVDRISEPALTGHRFVRDAEPDAAAMVADGVAVAAHVWQATILLRVDITEANRVIPPTIGTLEATPKGTLLRTGASELDDIARYLAGLPFEFEVRDPAELRAALRSLGRRLQQHRR